MALRTAMSSAIGLLLMTKCRGATIRSKPEKLTMSTCFPLYPRKRTHVGHRAMSVSCQHRKSPFSFDHLIGAAEQHRWHFEAECSRSLEINTQLEFGRLVKRDISRTSTSKNPIDEVGKTAKDVR